MENRILKWIEHNRFFVIGPIVGAMLWFYAASCTPVTPDPGEPKTLVTAKQLDQSFQTWQLKQGIMAKQYEFAGEDLKQQQEDNEKIKQLIIDIASANVADIPGLVTLLLGGGGLGALIDNIRKRGLISGLKRNA